MGVLEIIVGVLVLLVSLAVIVTVLFQQGHRTGVNGAISGVADTFLSKNKAKTADKILGKVTVILAVVFFVLALAANAISLYIANH